MSLYKEKSDLLVETLKLVHKPIGVKFYTNNASVPENIWRPYRDAKENYAMCQVVGLVKEKDIMICLTKEDHWCWKPLIGLGLVDIEKGSEPYNIALKNNGCNGCEDPEASARNFDKFPKLERNDNNAIVIGPLDQFIEKPDIVLIYCDKNTQCRWLVGALKYRSGQHIETTIDYIDSCMWSTIPTYKTSKPRITLPDPGEVDRGGCGENEIILTIPENLFDQMVVDCKMKIDDQNRRLNNSDGTPRMAAKMVPNFPRPGFYNVLYKLWGLNSNGVVAWSEKERES